MGKELNNFKGYYTDGMGGLSRTDGSPVELRHNIQTDSMYYYIIYEGEGYNIGQASLLVEEERVEGVMDRNE